MSIQQDAQGARLSITTVQNPHQQLANQQLSHHQRAITPLVGKDCSSQTSAGSCHRKATAWQQSPPNSHGEHGRQPAKGQCTADSCRKGATEYRQHQSHLRLFAVDWSRVQLKKEAFLSEDTHEVYKLDPQLPLRAMQLSRQLATTMYPQIGEYKSPPVLQLSCSAWKNDSPASRIRSALRPLPGPTTPSYADHKTVELAIVC